MRQQEVCRPVLFVVPFGGQQVDNHLVPAPVLAERVPQELLQGGPADVLRRRPTNQQIGPDRREMPDIPRIIQQVLNHLEPLVRRRVGQKCLRGFQVGHMPHQIQMHPTQPFAITGRPRRNHPVFRPPLANLLVDETDQFAILPVVTGREWLGRQTGGS